jgi:DNA-binding NarL/FixJ family response regulator
VTVGGRQAQVARETARRAVICLTDADLDSSLRSALLEIGFEAQSHSDLREFASAKSDENFVVLVLDDTQRGWLRVVADLMQTRPTVRPVVLSDIDNPDEFLAAVMAGVGGFCRKDASVDAIVRTVQSVYESGVAIPRDMVGPLVAHVRHGRGHRMMTAAGPINVTDREWEIMQLMLQRRTTREIADALFVSVGTIRSHVSALVHKVGAADRDDLVAMVERANRTR